MQGLQVKVSWYWGWSEEGGREVEGVGSVGTEGVEVVDEEREGWLVW